MVAFHFFFSSKLWPFDCLFCLWFLCVFAFLCKSHYCTSHNSVTIWDIFINVYRNGTLGILGRRAVNFKGAGEHW